MKLIKYRYMPPRGPEFIESEDFLDKFLRSLPHCFYMGYVPPMNVINIFLSRGMDEAGMSGGSEWVPFVIDKAEY